MRTVVVVLAMVLLTLPAVAQGKGAPPGEKKQTETKPKVDDSAYKNALGNLPAKKYDPWKDMR
ncbi:MAG: hypothetical protein QOG38_2875 [Hyphomicrobiales bacterium]|jgi:hypothetical protein|nr:hypothetical protein [Hyphomicrobiales bacterium]